MARRHDIPDEDVVLKRLSQVRQQLDEVIDILEVERTQDTADQAEGDSNGLER